VELCKNPIVKQEFLREHNSFGVSEGLTAIELPRNVYLESLTFLERGILTSTMKLQRFKAKMAYSEEIERMYKEGCIVKD
jgi:long-subunit acyl-CoA synthetase (AMP-forming)